MPPTGALAMYVKHDIMISGVDAAYASRTTTYQRLPTNYNPRHEVPRRSSSGRAAAATARASCRSRTHRWATRSSWAWSPVGQCFKTNGATSPPTPTPFFDAVLKEVEASSCVDTGKVFIAGFSSGSWLANQLGCVRASVLRGQGNCTGGLPGGLPTCAGPIAAMLAHDSDGHQQRDRRRAWPRAIASSRSTAASEPTPFPTTPARRRRACSTRLSAAYPVVWCQTKGKGHSDQIPNLDDRLLEVLVVAAVGAA